MKVVTFKRAGMENFCCHIEPIEIVFTNNKLTTITGPNGIGKTAIFQSIPYTLYGACEKGKGEDVLNDRVGKNCHTFVEFDIDEDFYRVDRYVKYEKIGSTVTISKNNLPPYKKGHREVVPEVEKLLIPATLFSNTILFSQKVKTFFTDLKDSDQKEIFRKILALEMFMKYYKKASDKYSSIVKEITDTKTSLKIIESVIAEILISITNQEDQKIKFEEMKQNVLRDLEKNKNEFIQKLEEEKTKLQEIINKNYTHKLEDNATKFSLVSQKLLSIHSVLEKDIQEIELGIRMKISEFESKAHEAKNNFSSIRIKEEEEIRNEYSKLKEEIYKQLEDIDKRIKELELIISSKSTTIEFLKKDKKLYERPDVSNSKICPVCFQDITEECLSKFDIERGKIEVRIFEEEEAIRSLNAELSPLYIKKEDILSQSKILTSNLEEGLIKIKERTETFVSEINDRLTKGKTKLKSMESEEKERKKDALSKEYDELNIEKINLENEKTILDRWVTSQKEAEKIITIIENNILNIENLYVKKENELFDESTINLYKEKLSVEKTKSSETIAIINQLERNLIMVEFWYEGFSPRGMQSMLIDDAIPFMNDRVSSYLSNLSNGRYSVSFDTMSETKGGDFRDKISVNVFDNLTHANARVKLSGGQERIVDVATILTLSDLQSNVQNVSFNILLFDEIFDALDDENINGVSRLLRSVSVDKAMFIISHRHIDSIESDEELMFH